MKIHFLTLTLVFSTYFGLQAQSETITSSSSELVLGFTTGILATTDFAEDRAMPFDVVVPLYVGPTWLKNQWGISPFYSFGGHSVGVFVTYAINDDLGTYIIWDHALNTEFGLLGAGVTTPLLTPYIQGFIELGSTYGNDSSPALSVGMWMSFGKTINN